MTRACARFSATCAGCDRPIAEWDLRWYDPRPDSEPLSLCQECGDPALGGVEMPAEYRAEWREELRRRCQDSAGRLSA